MICACSCGCKHDAGTVTVCLPCAAARRSGTTCAKTQRLTPEQASVSLSLAVRKMGRNAYAVPSLSEPGTDRTVSVAESHILCSCPWGFRVGAVSVTMDGLDKRPCRHMLAVAASGARYEPMPARDAFRLLGGS